MSTDDKASKSGDFGFRPGENKDLVSTHNLVRPGIRMTAKDLAEVREKFVAARQAKEADKPKGGRK